ncbi:hypothetical protein B6D60_08610 [candidate division KSB1 bacterium 4484_87]|nr:MAG: hypothetical protein B6D60_08610 [candidate division KSB1 bacterium 4484_87]
MDSKTKINNGWALVSSIVKYNLKIIFANRFFYFLLAAIIFFLLVTILNLASSESELTDGIMFYYLLVPGLLLVFYPTVFGIQNDVDSRMIEILFGIPNYRYKVWLVRMVLIYFVVALILLILALLSSLILVPFSVISMVYQLMFPIFFIGCAAFMISTLIKNGNGTAVVMIIIGLFFWIGTGFLPHKFNLFLNPFSVPSDMNEAVWADATFNNRIYIFIGTIISVLLGLIMLQKREKFV